MSRKYKIWFFIMPAAFLAGICLGSISAMGINHTAFFENAAQNLASPSLCRDSFQKALGQNLGCAALFFFFGTTLIGAFPAAILLSVRGYAIGQTVGVTVAAFGLRGLGAASCGIFPHNLLYVPFFCLLAVSGAGFSGSALQKDNLRRRLASYIFTMVLFTIPILMGCFVEGFVSAPLLKKLLAPVL